MNFPTETIDLPSKGLLYSKTNPLSSGKVEMKYMTAQEEDILTNTNYIEKGIVIDKLLQSMIVDKNINLNTLLLGDKEYLMVAARILGYGKEYKFQYPIPGTDEQEEIIVDLTQLPEKQLDSTQKDNEFKFYLPLSKVDITFKLLTQEDDNKIQEEVKGIKKLNKMANPEPSTRLKYIITSINGNQDSKFIREFVDKNLLIGDAKALRKEYNKISPGVEFKIIHQFSNGTQESINIPININFLWPDLEL